MHFEKNQNKRINRFVCLRTVASIRERDRDREREIKKERGEGEKLLTRSIFYKLTLLSGCSPIPSIATREILKIYFTIFSFSREEKTKKRMFF